MPALLVCIVVLLASACASRDRRPEVEGVGTVTRESEPAVREPDAGPIPLVPRDLVVGPTPTRPPPAVSGGTLGATSDGRFVVAADPDRDVIWIVDASDEEEPRLHGAVELRGGDEPGRLVEDGDGRLHVALRGSGELATIDPRAARLLLRRDMCPAPRGVAWASNTGRLHVVCAGGELVTLDPSGGASQRVRRIGPDLRDVVASGGDLYVSQLRSARVSRLDADGVPLWTVRPPDVSAETSDVVRTPSVAWRMLATADGDGVWLLHQRGVSGTVAIEELGYGGGECRTGVVESALTRISADGAIAGTWSLGELGLAVDVALDPETGRVTVATANPEGESVHGFSEEDMAAAAPGDCLFSSGSSDPFGGEGHTTSVARTPDGALVTLSREPAAIAFRWGVLPLPGVERDDSGLRLFHSTPRTTFLACASCHPEGREDGRVWDLATVGRHRTQSLTGGLLDTAPFHWAGDVPDMETVVRTTFTGRMLGGPVWSVTVDALGRWLDSLPPTQATVTDPAAVARGRDLFHSEVTGCAGCHSGDHLTDDETHDVGTGGAFQTPSLVDVAERDPWLHDGCAETLDEAIDGCGAPPGRHGDLSSVGDVQRADLVSYLRSL